DGVHSYSYDSENRLASVDGGSTATYSYDQQNQRYRKAVGTTVVHYIWESGQILGEHDGTTGASLADYTSNGSRMVAKLAGGSSYFLSDRLSVRETLDGSGNVTGQQAHFPFGEDFSESGTQQKQHFTSYERDAESGTDYATNRSYEAATGRFKQPDPLRGDASTFPQLWNRFTYALNSPVDLTDPTGLSPLIWWIPFVTLPG